ncbi:MAG: hypothetical protein ACKOBZ_08005 [Nitrospira sp.]|nr:hypothetical protein [Nitrospira sp.]
MTTPQHQPSGRDIKTLGGLFLIVGTMDMVIIAWYPDYALKIFGTSLSGTAGYLVKLQSPIVHFLIGYGFLFLRPWAWGLSLAYAGFGIASECLNQYVLGFSVIRSSFILTTLAFIGYLVWRRAVFDGPPLLSDKRLSPFRKSC